MSGAEEMVMFVLFLLAMTGILCGCLKAVVQQHSKTAVATV